MKGQYFSFDAIIATVIMVIAFTSFVSYWVGVQSVVDSRTSNLQVEALRVAETLFSLGSPSNWEQTLDLTNTRQIGISTGFSNQLSSPKIGMLEIHAAIDADYLKVAKLFRINADVSLAESSGYLITIQSTEGASVGYSIGRAVPLDAKESASAHRGATLNGRPVRVTVTLWRK